MHLQALLFKRKSLFAAQVSELRSKTKPPVVRCIALALSWIPTEEKDKQNNALCGSQHNPATPTTQRRSSLLTIHLLQISLQS